MHSKELFGYTFDNELIIVNGLITLLGLLVSSFFISQTKPGFSN
jgi:hypothetical protein